MAKFKDSWSKAPKQGLMEKFTDAVKPKGALKPRVETAVKRLQAQIGKMDGMVNKLKQRDQDIFQKIVVATQQHDTYSSKVLSNELVEVRKVSKILGNAKMGLERIELRLTTFHDLGDTVVTLMPTIGLMNGLKSSLVKFMPGADQEIGRMTEMLGGLMSDTFSSSESTFGVEEGTNAESEGILAEAAAVAESQSGDKFPSVPTMDGLPGMPSTESKFM
jgi:division protein CdvB (Snf7/Vps24/ESCRT-III family)|tara:strand:- start:466 stop:1122 length:657 start_codon:yes stop_codon:yes gene_type:complete